MYILVMERGLTNMPRPEATLSARHDRQEAPFANHYDRDPEEGMMLEKCCRKRLRRRSLFRVKQRRPEGEALPCGKDSTLNSHAHYMFRA